MEECMYTAMYGMRFLNSPLTQNMLALCAIPGKAKAAMPFHDELTSKVRPDAELL